MPYEIIEQGIGYVVVKQGTHQVIGRHRTIAEARAQLRALYANVRDGDGVWEILDGVTGEVVATLADEAAARTIADVMLKSGQIVQDDFGAEERRKLASKGQAMPDGSFPTPTKEYWFKARQAIGRVANDDKRGRVISYLKRRAGALGIPDDEIPDNWK